MTQNDKIIKNVQEKEIQKAIIQYLRLKKFIAFKHHSTGFAKDKDGRARPFKYGDKGIFDIIACSPSGRFWAIEVKRRGKKPTPDQEIFFNAIKANNGMAIIAYSIDDIDKEFSSFTNYEMEIQKKKNNKTQIRKTKQVKRMD